MDIYRVMMIQLIILIMDMIMDMMIEVQVHQVLKVVVHQLRPPQLNYILKCYINVTLFIVIFTDYSFLLSATQYSIPSKSLFNFFDLLRMSKLRCSNDLGLL